MSLPHPVSLWALLLAGHGMALAAAIPAELEAPARTAAVATALASLALGGVAAGRPAFSRRRRTLAALESACGVAAIALAGVALGAEADRAAWPLPVHPRPVWVELEGEIEDTTAADADPPALLFEALRVRVGRSASPCRSRVRLAWGWEGARPVWAVPGLRLRIEGWFRAPEDARNAGGAPPGVWLRRAGLEGTVEVNPRTVLLLDEAPDARLRVASRIRHHFARILARDLSAPTAALARGMLLGDRAGMSPAVRDAFRDAGTIHILSISGLHVCLLAGMLSFLATILHLPRRAAAAVECAGLWGYVVLVGAPAPALRSALLWTAVRTGRLTGRAVRPLAGWGLAGLVLHLQNPAALEDPGFLLSFAAALGLAAAGGLGAGPPGSRGESAARTGAWRRAVDSAARPLLPLAAQSLGAEAGTLGIQIKLFGAVPIAGIALNLAVVPLCGLFMGEAILYLACAACGPLPASWAAGPVEASGLALIALSRWAAERAPPWPARVEPPLLAVAAGIAAVLAAACDREARRFGGRASSSGSLWASTRWLLLAAALPLAPAVWGSAASWSSGRGEAVAPGGVSWIVFLDVGQGDAALVGLRGRHGILVDAGPSDGPRNAGRLVVEPALRAEGIERADLAVLSHGHRDHYGGFEWLARRGWITRLVEGRGGTPEAWRRDMAAALRAGGGRRQEVGGDSSLALARAVELRLVSAAERLAGAGVPAGENDRSLVARLEAGRQSFLFAGDVEEAAERALVPNLGAADVLKVPHHGSRTSSTGEWLAATRPRLAVISCGERNRFGHPDPRTVGRYRKLGALVIRTDQEGAIRLSPSRNGVWLSTQRAPEPVWISLSGERERRPPGAGTAKEDGPVPSGGSGQSP